jgi:hypothetical protein
MMAMIPRGQFTTPLYPDVPWYDPDIYNQTLQSLPAEWQPFYEASIAGAAGQYGQNQELIQGGQDILAGAQESLQPIIDLSRQNAEYAGLLPKQLEGIFGPLLGQAEQQYLNQQTILGNLYGDIEGSLQADPYSDALMQQFLDQGIDQITMDTQAAQQALINEMSNRGLMGGSAEARAMAELQLQGGAGRVALENQLAADQLSINQQANQARGQILGGLGTTIQGLNQSAQQGMGQIAEALSTGLIGAEGAKATATSAATAAEGLQGDLANREAVLGSLLMSDPLAMSNLYGDMLSSLIGQGNMEAALAMSDQIAGAQGFQGLFDTFGGIVSGMFPSADLLQGLGIGLQGIPNMLNQLLPGS